MPRSNKANLPWIDAVGGEVAERLSDRYARPMIFRQSGPYNQRKKPHVGVYFNDPILHHISPTKPGHTVDFRFGFYLERCFSPTIDSYVVLAGFDMFNPTLGMRFLMPNIRAERETVAGKLSAWLRRNERNHGHVNLGSDSDKYLAFGDDDPADLDEALGVYATLPRNIESITWRRIHLSAIARLPEFVGWDDADLLKGSSDVATAALSSFEGLDFLYSLLFPRDLGPSRLSNGQNRALKTKQPDRRCSWVVGEHCSGIVDAAHIKPDRLGGHAVPGNLFWLCQFHHKLLDTYLKAGLTLDRPSRRIVASVGAKPPAPSKAGGIPLAIWESIEDKRVWVLPLRSESIVHLFDRGSAARA